MRVKITTTIDVEQYKTIKKNNWKISQVIDAGIGSLINPSVVQEKLIGQDSQIEQLKRSIVFLRGKISNIEKVYDSMDGAQNENSN